jgi:hypothetical protein
VPACRTKKRQWVIALTAIAVGWPWWRRASIENREMVFP